MKLVTVYFDYKGSNNYRRLLNAMLRSAKKIGYEIDVIETEPPKPNGEKRSFDSNTHKLDLWVDYLRNAPEDEEVVFLDCDLIFLNHIDDAFDRDFDIAYTYRDVGVPINGGVMFIRNNKHSRSFIEQWVDVNSQMYTGKMNMQPYYDRYAGINQSAFGYMLDQDVDCDVIGLPCTIYNACSDRWRNLHEDTRIIHVKDELRRACLRIRFAPWIDHVREIWDEFDKME